MAHAAPVARAAAAAIDGTGAPPRVLILAPHGSYRLAPFVSAATALELAVVVGSESRFALGTSGAEAVRVDFEEPDGVLDRLLVMHQAAPFVAVVGTDDASTELAALVSARLGLPHNPVDSTRIARRKDLARERLAARGVRVPAHRILDRHRELKTQIVGLEFPVVAKPVALSASRGVIRADDPVSLAAAVRRIGILLNETHDPTEASRILVERFIPGAEVALEGLLCRGRLQVLAIFDKPEPLDGPYFEETYYITPSSLDLGRQKVLQETVQAACEAYGLREGPIHAECRVNGEGVWVLEVAARTIGGNCARLLRFGLGMSLESLVLRHAMGMRVEHYEPSGGAGVLMIPIPRAGVLKRVEGVLAAERVPGIEEVRIEVREGYELVPLPDGSSYLGFIFARADTAMQAEHALRRAHACLNVVVQPFWKLDARGDRRY